MSDLAAMLSTERLRLTLAVRDWLVGEARDIADPNVIIEGLSLKLRDAGVPIDRAVSAVEFRHAERAAAVMKLLDVLEDNDDVQNVYANFDISEAVLQKMSA